MRMFKLLYVYMLKCNDDSFYVGITNNIDRRLIEHNEGLNKDAYTFDKRPVTLVYWQEFTDYKQALDWETQLKKWGRRKKEALIVGDWERIKELATCRNKTSHKNKKN